MALQGSAVVIGTMDPHIGVVPESPLRAAETAPARLNAGFAPWDEV